MNRHWNSYLNRTLSRRELLRVSSTGFGSLALAGLLGDRCRRPRYRAGGAPGPLAVKAPHFPPRAKRVIFLFMHGGPSQVDTFDYKPLLKRDHGKPLPFPAPESSLERDVQPAEIAVGVPTVRAERHVGERPVSRIRQARGRCLLHQVHVRLEFAARRGAARTAYRQRYLRAAVSMGSWITYGLGTENQSMPGFITICPTQSHGGANNYASALPAGAVCGNADRRGGDQGARRADPIHRQ